MGKKVYTLINLQKAFWQGVVTAGDGLQMAQESHPKTLQWHWAWHQQKEMGQSKEIRHFSHERCFYFSMKACIPIASAPELWPRPPFSSFSSEVSSMDSCCILKPPTQSLCRMTEKFQRTLIACFHTPLTTTKKRAGEHHPEPECTNQYCCVSEMACWFKHSCQI